MKMRETALIPMRRLFPPFGGIQIGSYCARADVEHFGCIGLAYLWCLQICRGHMLITGKVSSLHIRQLCRHHSALRLVQVPAVQIQTDDKSGAAPWPLHWLARLVTLSIAFVPCHNQSLRVNPATGGDTLKNDGTFDGTSERLKTET